MTSHIQIAAQAKKHVCITVIDKWFIARYYNAGLGACTLDGIYGAIMALPEVIAYLEDVEAPAAKQARLWIVRTALSKHLCYYIDNKAE